MNYEYIKSFTGKIIGKISTESNGDKKAMTFEGQIIAKYNKKMNYTTDFYGKILGKGDLTEAIIYTEEAKRELQKNGMKI